MPITPTYPGVYIEEISSGVHPITGVATSITAFVGYAQRGPVNRPVTIQSFAEFTRVFGGLWSESTMTYALQQFFLNGGSQALIVRVAHLSGGTPAAKGVVDVGGATNPIHLLAKSEGAWSKGLLVRIDHDTTDPTSLFNLSVKDTGTGQVEVLRNLSVGPTLGPLVGAQSSLVDAVPPFPSGLPEKNDDISPGDDPFDPNHSGRYTTFSSGTPGVDGDQTEDDLVPGTDDGTGVYALARADLFNILCIPPVLPSSNSGSGRVLGASKKVDAATFCLAHRALFLVDPHPDWRTPADVTSGSNALDTYTTGMVANVKRNAAIYMPYVKLVDPLTGVRSDFPPCGEIAGAMARTDAERGVWKAPAGVDVGLNGVQELTAKLTDGENGILNPLGVNCLRTFPVYGNVVWGARTLIGADVQASEWKYVPVRRFALFLEESLYRGTQWVVFEPNDEPLWAQIRLNVGAFMHDLFRKGAFKGASPRDAYLVKCDAETTTQTDINNGVVNVVVGFAPLNPAEFVIIQIQQLAGQIET